MMTATKGNDQDNTLRTAESGWMELGQNHPCIELVQKYTKDIQDISWYLKQQVRERIIFW